VVIAVLISVKTGVYADKVARARMSQGDRWSPRPVDRLIHKILGLAHHCCDSGFAATMACLLNTKLSINHQLRL